ncbi:MAG: hypothetical protein MJZ12_09230, partial [Prevotella sp.]|nr:hypothetical protein [Prevotella sp.]
GANLVLCNFLFHFWGDYGVIIGESTVITDDSIETNSRLLCVFAWTEVTSCIIGLSPITFAPWFKQKNTE